MTSAPPPKAPSWLPVWLAALAPLFIVSPLSLLGWPALKSLPRPAQFLLAFYALTQVLPSLLAPQPLLALGGALLRTVLMFGLMGLGTRLPSSQSLWPAALGLGAVYLTALGYSALNGLDLFTGRLAHPYMTSTTLGLAGAFGVWFALFLRGHWGWRLPLGLGGAAALLLSGSRGPLLAALLGSVFALLAVQRRRLLLPFMALLLLGGGAVTVGERFGLSFLTRLTQLDTTGRDVVWNTTLSVIQTYPVAGVGSYRLGASLTPPSQPCALLELPNAQEDASKQDCPTWIARLGNPWLIAHNVTLQQLAETGPLGVLGLFVLLGVVLASAFAARDALSLALLGGLLVTNINDNTLLVPSPFFAELFWLLAGLHLRHWSPAESPWRAGLTGAGLLTVLSLPLWAAALPPQRAGDWGLTYFSAPPATGEQRVYVQLSGPSGSYRAVLRACDPTCVTLETVPFSLSETQKPIVTLKARVKPGTPLRLQILPARSTFGLNVLTERRWKAGGQP